MFSEQLTKRTGKLLNKKGNQIFWRKKLILKQTRMNFVSLANN